MVLVAVQLSVMGLYLPPVLEVAADMTPPQTIISLPVHTAVCLASGIGRVGGAGGCPTVSAGIVSSAGVQIDARACPLHPRQSFRCRSRLPVTRYRPEGALMSVVGVQSSAARGTSYYRKLVGAFANAACTGEHPPRMRRRARSLDFAQRFSSRSNRLTKRSASTGLAKHSAITKGSFPRASNSSCKTSGCLV